jgi:hypothetical protein
VRTGLVSARLGEWVFSVVVDLPGASENMGGRFLQVDGVFFRE